MLAIKNILLIAVVSKKKKHFAFCYLKRSALDTRKEKEKRSKYNSCA